MAHDSNASSWIQMVNKTKKEYSEEANKYYIKFVKGNAVPTQTDVANLTKLCNEMKADSDAIIKDCAEMEMVSMTFGGSADAVVRNTKILLETVKKKAAQK